MAWHGVGGHGIARPLSTVPHHDRHVAVEPPPPLASPRLRDSPARVDKAALSSVSPSSAAAAASPCAVTAWQASLGHQHVFRDWMLKTRAAADPSSCMPSCPVRGSSRWDLSSASGSGSYFYTRGCRPPSCPWSSGPSAISRAHISSITFSSPLSWNWTRTLASPPARPSTRTQAPPIVRI